MADKYFCSGHDNFYHGAHVDYELFRMSWDLYGTAQISMGEAANICGVSTPTYHKWAEEIIEKWGIDDGMTFFTDNKKKFAQEKKLEYDKRKFEEENE